MSVLPTTESSTISSEIFNSNDVNVTPMRCADSTNNTPVQHLL